MPAKPNQERRKQTRLAKLGTSNPICLVCRESRWQCLELHHVAGKKHSDELVVLCKNCHAIESDRQKDQPDASIQSSRIESIGYQLLGLAGFFQQLAVKLKFNGELLIHTEREKHNDH